MSKRQCPWENTGVEKRVKQEEEPTLPIELWVIIFNFLQWNDWRTLRESCCFFREIIDQHILSQNSAKEEVGLDALYGAVKNHKLSVCIWLHQVFHFTEQDGKLKDNVLFLDAVGGQLDLCEWLQDTFHFTPEDVHTHKSEAICVAAGNGTLDVCQWLHETFTLTTYDVEKWGALQFAADEGHLSICQWLYTTFSLTADHVRAEHNQALYWAASNGHLPVCQWLHTTFQLTADDARDHRDGTILIVAAHRGHLDVCEWLWSTFQLTVEDMIYRFSGNHALYECVKSGNLSACKWLVQAGQFTRENALQVALTSLYYALNWCHYEIADWIYITFQIQHNDEPHVNTSWGSNSPYDPRVLWMRERGLMNPLPSRFSLYSFFPSVSEKK